MRKEKNLVPILRYYLLQNVSAIFIEAQLELICYLYI